MIPLFSCLHRQGLRLGLLGVLGAGAIAPAHAQLAAPPPPVPDRGPQILEMQFASRAQQPAGPGMSGREASMVYGNYVASGQRGNAPAAPPPGMANPYAITPPPQ